MSKFKENLISRYLELKEKFEEENFQRNVKINSPSYLNKEFSVDELYDKIHVVEAALIEKDKRLKTEAYYKTKDGQNYKEKLEQQLIENQHKNLSINKQLVDFVNNYLHQTYSEQWTSLIGNNFDGWNIEIGLKNTDNSRKGLAFEFGLSFTINFDNSTQNLKMNYGTMGQFDILNDLSRKEYLKGLGTISNDNIWLNELIKKCHECYLLIQDLNHEYDQILINIKNPLGL